MKISVRQIARFFHVNLEIVPFTPELLADLDELGSFPETIVSLLPYLEKHERLLAQLTSQGDELVREVTIPLEEVRKQNRLYTERITGRVQNLSREHPQHRKSFEGYLEREQKECAILEDYVVCATWLLRRGDH